MKLQVEFALCTHISLFNKGWYKLTVHVEQLYAFKDVKVLCCYRESIFVITVYVCCRLFKYL